MRLFGLTTIYGFPVFVTAVLWFHANQGEAATMPFPHQSAIAASALLLYGGSIIASGFHRRVVCVPALALLTTIGMSVVKQNSQ